MISMDKLVFVNLRDLIEQEQRRAYWGLEPYESKRQIVFSQLVPKNLEVETIVVFDEHMINEWRMRNALFTVTEAPPKEKKPMLRIRVYCDPVHALPSVKTLQQVN